MIAWRTFAYPVAALVLSAGCGDDEMTATSLSVGSVSNSSGSGSESSGSGGGASSSSSSPTDPGGSATDSGSTSTNTTVPGTSTEEPGTSTDASTTNTTNNTTQPAGCGNGAIDPNEQCDGGNLNGFTCDSLGAGTGTLGCDPMTCTFDTSMCDGGGGTSG